MRFPLSFVYNAGPLYSSLSSAPASSSALRTVIRVTLVEPDAVMGQARRGSLGKVGRLLYVMVPANDRAVKSERVKPLAKTPMGIDEHRRHLHNTHTHAHTSLPYIRVTLRLWHMWHASLNWVRSIAFPATQTICQSTELTYCQSIVNMQRLDGKETKPSQVEIRLDHAK